MVLGNNRRSRQIIACLVPALLLLVHIEASQAQLLRSADLGVWLVRQRNAQGESSVIVTDLVSDGIFAKAGLREGDRIASIDNRPIEREAQFAQDFLNDRTVKMVLSRRGENHTLVLESPAVMEGAVAPDPFYQAGLLFDEHDAAKLSVQRVFTCTPAFYAGLRPGDTLISANHRPLASPHEFAQEFRQGRDLNLLIHRNGQPRQLTLLTPTPLSRLRSTTNLTSPSSQPPYTSPTFNPPPAPLLAPPPLPNPTPAILSPPPAIPSLPPPGAVPRG